MSQQSKRSSTFTSTDLPVKRRRGRPRKDDNQVKKENAHLPVAPASDGTRKNQHVEVDQTAGIDDDMVGQVVSGVIEGSFDAGYLLSVKIANSNTILRGVVFQPGLFSPLTAANDIAPNAKMYKRKELPIPALHPQVQVQVHASVPQLEQNSKQPFQSENQAPIVPEQVLPTELHSGTPFALDQSPSVTVLLTDNLLTDNLPKRDISAQLGGEILPQQNSEFGLDNQFASQLEHTSTVKQDQVMHESEPSDPLGPKVELEVTKDVISGPASVPTVDILPGNDSINHVPLVQHQAVDSGLVPSGLVHDKLKSSNSELHQTPVVAKPQPEPSQPISEPIDFVMEKPISPKNDAPQDIQSELAAEVLKKDETSTNGNLLSDAAKNTEGGSQSAPKKGEATPSELEPAAEESVLPGMLESQISSTAGHTNNVDFVL
ncbi:uncharacterized protein LOC132270516 [Cornus florida]|uniref:uncharacterized protein LOC132270516 n=1 Tax=Cornus florida TaxID=4283 RepID=UPI002897AD60|nr:uncharacterized protein LOC132270516 [Cornus florida]